MIKDKTFIEICKSIATESKCVSLHVGSVIVLNNRIISLGYNGTPPGDDNCCDVNITSGTSHSSWSQQYEIHSEMNAILFAAKSGSSINGATIYCTHSPCDNCLKHIIGSGIVRIVYDKLYRDSDINSAKAYANTLGVKYECLT